MRLAAKRVNIGTAGVENIGIICSAPLEEAAVPANDFINAVAGHVLEAAGREGDRLTRGDHVNHRERLALHLVPQQTRVLRLAPRQQCLSDV